MVTKKLYVRQSIIFLGNRNNNPMPESKSSSELAEEFTCYLLNKILTIRKQFENIPSYEPTESDTPKLKQFRLLSQQEVKHKIFQIKTT